MQPTSRANYMSISLLILLSMGLLKTVAAENGLSQPPALELLLEETPEPAYGVRVPARISGHVLLHERGTTSGVKGVSVTDGYSVVKTDARGAYAFTPDPSAVFVSHTGSGELDVLNDDVFSRYNPNTLALRRLPVRMQVRDPSNAAQRKIVLPPSRNIAPIISGSNLDDVPIFGYRRSVARQAKWHIRPDTKYL